MPRKPSDKGRCEVRTFGHNASEPRNPSLAVTPAAQKYVAATQLHDFRRRANSLSLKSRQIPVTSQDSSRSSEPDDIETYRSDAARSLAVCRKPGPPRRFF